MKYSPFKFFFFLLSLSIHLLLGNPSSISTKNNIIENRPLGETVTTVGQPTTAVIHILNRLGDQYTSQADGFSDLLTAEISDFGFKIIPPDIITQGISQLQGRARVPDSINSISDNSMKELSSMLGADCFLIGTLNDLRESTIELPSLNRKVTTYQLRVSYRIHSVSDGGSFLGKSFRVEKKFPITQNLTIKLSKASILSDLIDDAVAEISKHIFQSDLLAAKTITKFGNTNQREITNPLSLQQPSLNQVEVIIEAKLLGMKMPQLIKNEKSDLVFSGNQFDIISTSAEVEIDGLLVGSSSATQSISIPKGIHRLKIRHAGHITEERLINAHQGMKISISIQPSPEEYERWRTQLLFLENAKAGAILTANEQKIAEGMMEYLKNSKFEVPEINLNKSLF
jgi:hypothetical protein